MTPSSSSVDEEEVKTCPTKNITWRIENYSKVVKQKGWLFSTPFMFEGFNWQMSLNPSTKAVGGHLSLYLGVVQPNKAPVGWFVDANVVFKLIDQHNPNDSFSTELYATFNSTFPRLGCSSFVSIEKLQNKKLGFLLNDTCVFEVEVTVTAASAVPKVVTSCVNKQKPLCEDYLLHLETMDAIHAKARSFLKSSKLLEDHKSDDVKLLQDAVKAEEGIIAKISKLRNMHAQELEAAAKDAKKLIDQSLDSTIIGTLDVRCALRLASLCTDLDECVKIHKGVSNYKDGIDKQLDALRKKCDEESDVARKQADALIGQRVEASKRTQQLFVKITNEKVVVGRSRSKTTTSLWIRNLISRWRSHNKKPL